MTLDPGPTPPGCPDRRGVNRPRPHRRHPQPDAVPPPGSRRRTHLRRRALSDPGWLLPWVAVTAVVVLDTLATSRPWPLLIAGLADEPAHLLTAWLILVALPERVAPRSVWPWVLVASVAIDADHVPQYTWDPGFAVDGGRPPTHGLVTVLLLLAFGAARPCRTWALGLAGGVALHLLRDVATGPGIPLLWPVVHAGVLVPYPLYLVVLIVAASVTSVRYRRRRTAGP